jgi:methionyl-tRNA formyltransferase/putative component of membrane protein insertase Oxa1/YidC/SpoIIIJ protein YidD
MVYSKKKIRSPKLNSLLSKLNTQIAKFFDIMIIAYQKTFSPDKWVLSSLLKGKICSHHPHCSQYCRECLRTYGFIPGIIYGIERILSCRPSWSIINDPHKYSIVFFSWSPIGISFLEWLNHDKRFDIKAIVTMPDAPSGRWQKLQQNCIAEYAQQHISQAIILKPQSLRHGKHLDAEKTYQLLCDLKPDFFVVIAYGKILPQQFLDIPTYGPINVHGSLLPYYRGASPLQSVFLNHESKSGITIMKMVAECDAGDILTKKICPLAFDRTVKHLIERITKKWPPFLNQTLRDYAKWRIKPTIQDISLVTHTQKIQKSDWMIDMFSTPLQDCYAKRKAYYLRPKIFMICNQQFWPHCNKRIIIEELTIDQQRYQYHLNNPIIWSDLKLNPAITKIILRPEGKQKINRNDFQQWYLSHYQTLWLEKSSK